MACRHLGTWILVLVLASLLACTKNQMYRPVSVERTADYALAYVEFDDQGELWSEAQLYRALETIRASNDSPEGAIVFVFIHGWNHSAAETDKHASGFESILAQVAAEERLTDGSPRPVVGIYLGWRGKNVKFPGLLPFSFFNRRGAAERISGTAATEVIYRSALAAKENEASKVVLLGHSFGGMILERAVTQAMVGSVLEAGDRNRLFPADAVILLNPASQSIQAKGFIETLERERIRLYRKDSRGRRYERPLIVSVTSTGDRATKWLFPIGLGFKSLGKKFRSYEEDNCTPIGKQKTFFRRTAGHNTVMLSHGVGLAGDGDVAAQSSVLEGGFGNVRASYDPVTRQVYFLFAGDDQMFYIKRRQRSQNDSPYWIFRVSEELIADHSDIFGVNTVRLVGAILGVTGALARESRTELVRERSMRPLDVIALSDGAVVVLDRDRRIYRIDEGSEPSSIGCIPQDVDAADRIGVQLADGDGRVVLNRRDDRRWVTEVLRVNLTPTGPQLIRSQQLESDARFNLAAIDLEENRIFLAPPEPGLILVATLDKKRAVPEVYARFGGVGELSALEYDPVYGRLYFTDGRSGSVFMVEETEEGRKTHIVGSDLGLPAGIAVDGERDAVYVIDASSGDVLRFECGAQVECAEPIVVSNRWLLREPTTLEVAIDGTLWVASRESQKVMALSPSGEVVRAIEEWPRPGL